MAADTPDRDWLVQLLGQQPVDPKLYVRALTHASRGEPDYERLEFLGDRVLGLTVSAWLFELFPDEPEGSLSRRFNALVARETCAEVARNVGVGPQLRLGKQAREDGAQQSDNVLGDVIEAILGAFFLERGFEDAAALVRRLWTPLLDRSGGATRHPKSALQEWAAANRCRPPVYTLAGRAGPQHAPSFRIVVTIPGRAEAEGEGSSKQEAETAAARALLARLGARPDQA